MKSYVLDSYSLIAYFEKDDGSDKMVDLFDNAVNDNIGLYMNVINWGEVYYI